MLFVGLRYNGGTVPLVIISLAIGLTSASAIINTCLLVLGRTRVLLLAGLLGVIAEVACSPLIIVLGLNGAAAARTVLMVVSLATSWLLLRRSVDRAIDLKAMAKVLSCALIEGGAVLAVELVLYNAYLLPLYITVGGAVYLLSLRYIKVLRQDDVALIHKLFPARLRFLVDALSRLARRSRS